MSYLYLPSIDLADFDKGTISLWFRYSKDAVDNSKEYAAAHPSHDVVEQGPDILRNTIPLVTFGREVRAKTYTSNPHHWVQATPDGGQLTDTTLELVETGEVRCEPSHLGLVVDPARPDDNNNPEEGVFLKILFQMNTRALIQGLLRETTNLYWVDMGTTGVFYQQYTEVRDISYVRTSVPEQFNIESKVKVDADKWHHLLVSFDLSTRVRVEPTANSSDSDEDLFSQTVKSYCKIWYAFDDVNKTGKDNMGYGWAPQNVNGIVPMSAKYAAISDYSRPPPALDHLGNPITTGEIFDPLYDWTASPLPIEKGHVGLPAGAANVDTIYHCELAEFQFFGGLAVDTADSIVRRQFVDNKGKPVNPQQAEQHFGRRPHVLLHGSSNWKKGFNAGSTGVSGTGDVIPGGQFTPVAGIKSFKPDPSI
jgi:hypothetical protein